MVSYESHLREPPATTRAERRDLTSNSLHSPVWKYAGTAQLREVFICAPQQSDEEKK